ncbi:MAG: hybrid sensor histidine kinase/response regulator [Acidobacteria bacterium]|nr:hybrid sensor histidine kinase/response regulator [Acidobacteriota bacterium]
MSDKRILIVDDDEAILGSLSALMDLVFEEYSSLTAESAKEAMKILAEKDISLIISDFLMPEMDGIQFLIKAKETYPDIPRILLTGYADKENAIKAINNAGIYYYLEKPWDNEELKLIVKNALEKRDLITELEKKLKELGEAQEALIQSEKMSAIGKVTSMIMHDIKTPLTIIRGTAEVLDNDSIKDNKDLYIERIIRAADKISNMIGEILSFSRGNWEIQINKASVDSKSFQQDLIRPLEELSERYSVEFSSDINFDGYIKIDIEKITRVMNNLFSNGIESGGDPPKIDIKVYNSGKNLIIEFKDNGTGIPKEILDSIFTPFFTHGKMKGIGLGLAICNEIVSRHNGTIKAGNLETGGAIFTITLPMEG